MKNWKSDVLLNTHFTFDEKRKIYTSELDDNNLSIKFHEKMPKGAALRELEKIHLHLSYWETPYYKRAIKNFIKEIDNRSNKLAIDIGCGDGRFTELLLSEGFGKVVAIDSDIKALKSLAYFAERENLEDRLLIIQCSADNILLPDLCADLVLAIGVFYYLNENFGGALSEASRIIKPNSILVNSEPDMEGAVYKSLFFEEIDDMIENFESHCFKEEKGKTDYKFRLFTQDEIKSIFNKHGFKTIDSHHLSLLPSILRIKMVRDGFTNEEISEKETKIRQVFDYFDQNGSLSKHIIWKNKKDMSL